MDNFTQMVSMHMSEKIKELETFRIVADAIKNNSISIVEVDGNFKDCFITIKQSIPLSTLTAVTTPIGKAIGMRTKSKDNSHYVIVAIYSDDPLDEYLLTFYVACKSLILEPGYFSTN